MIKICFDRTLVVADVFADFAPHRLRKKIEVKQNELRKIKKKFINMRNAYVLHIFLLN